MDSPLSIQKAFLHAAELETNIHLQTYMTTSEKKEFFNLHGPYIPGKTSNDLVGRRPYRDNEKAKWWDNGEKITECQNDNMCVECKTTICCKFEYIVPETENMPSKRYMHPYSVEETKSKSGTLVKELSNGYFGYPQISKELVKCQLTEKEVRLKTSSNQSFFLGNLVGKLSDAYKDAMICFQNTQDIIQHVRRSKMKIVTKMAEELSLAQHKQIESEPSQCLQEKRVCFENVPEHFFFSASEEGNMSPIRDLSEWPEGSVSSTNVNPKVFCQKLVQFPKYVLNLQSFSSQDMLHFLSIALPVSTAIEKLSGIYWLTVANFKQNIPQPCCLLLFEKDMYAITTGNDSNCGNHSLTVFHHFHLLNVKEIQVSFVGQHIQLIGSSQDTFLAVFTYSKELTQELCRTLLKFVISEDVGAHPLLQQDLMYLSLDWKSNVPNLLLDSGFKVTSYFKRALADLLYIIHGNMEGVGSMSVAEIHPLVYTSVRVENSTLLEMEAICQLLLTDTHVCLLQEDGVFHSVPRGSSLVQTPVQTQFRDVKVRHRSDVRCVLVKQSGTCIVLDIIFTRAVKKRAEMDTCVKRGSPQDTILSDQKNLISSWKLTFGSTTDALLVLNHLSS